MVKIDEVVFILTLQVDSETAGSSHKLAFNNQKLISVSMKLQTMPDTTILRMLCRSPCSLKISVHCALQPQEISVWPFGSISFSVNPSEGSAATDEVERTYPRQGNPYAELRP
jgi:hypothetical protein